ncbi:MAG: BatA and WFA domain-containing protein [Planctomycetota bacterium]
MSLASPDKLIWLLAALPIVVFYILKTRLRRRPVSTLLFWDQIFEQKRQRSLWQNLRHWLSLLLQLAFVLLMGFALADPLWKSQTDTGQDLILVVDNSASMAALDDSGRTRLERAIERASDVAGTLRNGDNIALVTAGTSVKVRVGMSDFAPTVQEALAEIEPTDGPTRIDEAIAAARRLAADVSKRRIVVFSDGCVEDRDDPASEEDVSWVRVGDSQDNLAITTFQVRRSTVDPIGYSLLLEVQNYGEEDAETRLTLMLDEALVDVVPITIAAGESFRTQIDGTSQAGGVLLGQIDVEDALQVDNQARAVLPERPEIPVRLIVGEDTESYYLERVLESLPLVRVLQADADEKPSLTVISGVVPESIPEGPVLIADVASSGPKLGDGETAAPAWVLGDAIENPIIAKQERSSPLMRHVQLQNVILAGGKDLEVSETLGAATTLLETASGARVCVSIERPQGRILMLACDLDTSDLPLRIAFPVMMTNAMNWFFRETGEIRPALATGIATDVAWDIAEEKKQDGVATLIDPAGGETLITFDEDRAKVGALEIAGVYGLRTGEPKTDTDTETAEATEGKEESTLNEAETLIAVNLCDTNESDLRIPDVDEVAIAELPPASRSPWFYLIVAACGLVLTEWALFQRRVVA